MALAAFLDLKFREIPPTGNDKKAKKEFEAREFGFAFPQRNMELALGTFYMTKSEQYRRYGLR